MPLVTVTIGASQRVELPVYQRDSHLLRYPETREQSAWPVTVNGNPNGFLYRNRFGWGSWVLFIGARNRGVAYFLPPAYEVAEQRKLVVRLFQWLNLDMDERRLPEHKPVIVRVCEECFQRHAIDVKPQSPNSATFCWSCGSQRQKWVREA